MECCLIDCNGGKYLIGICWVSDPFFMLKFMHINEVDVQEVIQRSL